MTVLGLRTYAHDKDAACTAARATRFWCTRQEWKITCHDIFHCVTTWAFYCSGRLSCDMNLDVVTGPQAVGVFLCRDTNFNVAIERLLWADFGVAT